MTPSAALDELAAQHTMLRELIERCLDLADQVDAGAANAGRLVDEVARLRLAFDAHNQFEEQLLRPLLLDADWMGAVRVARMVEEHVDEHRAMRGDLADGPTSALRDVLASLRTHLTAEERYFGSPRGLRDDLQ